MWDIPGNFTVGRSLGGMCVENPDLKCSGVLPPLIAWLLGSPKPLHELADSLFNRSLRIVTEQLSGPGNVGKGLRHIPGLRSLRIDDGFFAELLFQQRDQFC